MPKKHGILKFFFSNHENFEYLEKAPSYDEVMEASDLPKKVDPTKVTQSSRPKRTEAERQARRQQRRRQEGSGQRRSTDGGRRHGRSNRCYFDLILSLTNILQGNKEHTTFKFENF